MKPLANLSFASALDLALGESGLTRDDVGHEMGWSVSKTSRVFCHDDNYWPNMPSIPQLCLILGNDVLLDWLRVNTNELRLGRHDCAPKLTEVELLRLLSEIGEEMGEVNGAINEALKNDHNVDARESKKIIREAYDVLSRYRELIAAMRVVQEGV
ncbi:phage regulatory CII family protein [Halodesulfovibrio aestuarii]|uniref:Phage regulatory CII family protein n=1 Tax=Halodesulfovibrio aestuarii TaxID=126333 RepID=A0ABV4JUB9_9BACT